MRPVAFPAFLNPGHGSGRGHLLQSKAACRPPEAGDKETVMSKPSRSFASAFIALLLASPVLAHADVLLMQRVEKEQGADLPARGISMAQVQARFGAPISKLDPRGGDSSVHPVINRWEYANFVVYFEREHVIDSVLKRAESTELGPKQAH
jgi:hypothetical protein